MTMAIYGLWRRLDRLDCYLIGEKIAEIHTKLDMTLNIVEAARNTLKMALTPKAITNFYANI